MQKFLFTSKCWHEQDFENAQGNITFIFNVFSEIVDVFMLFYLAPVI